MIHFIDEKNEGPKRVNSSLMINERQRQVWNSGANFSLIHIPFASVTGKGTKLEY